MFVVKNTKTNKSKTPKVKNPSIINTEFSNVYFLSDQVKTLFRGYGEQ